MIHRFKLLKFLFFPIKIHLKFLQGGELTTAKTQSDVFNIFHQLPKHRGVIVLVEPLHSADDISFICSD